MEWFDVDGAMAYLSERGKTPSRKVIYQLVKDGLKVARIGETGRHMLFSVEWLDEYLARRAHTERRSR